MILVGVTWCGDGGGGGGDEGNYNVDVVLRVVVTWCGSYSN